MIKGLSFQKGILFIGHKYVACSYNENDKWKTWIKPKTSSTMVEVGKMIFTSMPRWFYLFLMGWVILIIYPYVLRLFGLDGAIGLPLYTLIYFMIGTHFWFPKELKKYHGAEHKVFSFRGVVSVRNHSAIKRAEITNRGCSTNAVVLYFLLLVITAGVLLAIYETAFRNVLEAATYISLIIWPATIYWLNRTKKTKGHEFLLLISYWLQRHVTTLEPDDVHVKTAIRAYRKLALKEFPKKLVVKRKKKEEIFMAIADITIMPLGSNSTSVSDVVAEVHRTLKQSKLPIKYELTSMSTLIEGEIADIYAILKEIQEVPFKLGHQRVATNIRIDDRRDRPSSIKGKIESVEKKIAEHQIGEE
ncbi:MTH1187 family thiamine-binding protein [Salipaludibacillus sp. HK11]|uniref:MTH1187 family thiamine-binding protein n=1 Tax=Salipaludibacillus sp. HK11 TaxID=3394320 RepID=UPI0039FC34C2